MTRRDAKREALRVAALVLESAPMCWEKWDDRTEEDRLKLEAAWEEIVAELDRRGHKG